MISDWTHSFVEIGNLSESHKSRANHADEFKAPLNNVWKQQDKTPGSGHFGNSEVRWVDNLLKLYTQPFDVVVDPFEGGVTTTVVSLRLGRKCVGPEGELNAPPWWIGAL